MPHTTAPTPSRRGLAAGGSRIREVLAVVDQPGVLSLAGGMPAPEDLDDPGLDAAVAVALTRRGRLGRTALQYAPTEGVAALRELLAARYDVGVDQVLVTAGAQQAIALTVLACCDPGDRLALADPAYLGAVQVARASGVALAPVAADGDGLDVDDLADQLRGGAPRPRLTYVTASFHNPTGADLPLERRRALAEVSDRWGVPVVDDDPYRELRFTGPPPPSPGALAELGLQVGSASKVVAPGLRVGWLVGPSALVAAAARLKQGLDLHTGALAQLVVAELLADEVTHAARVARRRQRLAGRAAALVAAVERHLGDRLRVAVPAGGMFCWGTAADGTDADDLLARAVARGVAFVPGSSFAVVAGRHRSSLRLSFASLDEDDLDEAVRRLALAWPADRVTIPAGPLVGAGRAGAAVPTLGW